MSSDITYDKLTREPSLLLREYCALIGLDEPTMGNRFAWIDYNCDNAEELHFQPACHHVTLKQLPYVSVGNSFIALVLGPDVTSKSHWNVIFQLETLQVTTEICLASMHLSRLKPLNICDLNVEKSIPQSLLEFAHNPFSLEELKHLVMPPSSAAPSTIQITNPRPVEATSIGTANRQVPSRGMSAKAVDVTPQFGTKPTGKSHGDAPHQQATGVGAKPTTSCQVSYGFTGSGFGAAPVGTTSGGTVHASSRTGFGARPTSSTGFGGFGPPSSFGAKSTGFGSTHSGGFGASSTTGFGHR